MPMEVEFPDDFMSGLLDTTFDEIAEAGLNAASPILTQSVTAALSKSVASRGQYSTGKMISSIKATKAKKAKTDAWIVVARPTGKDAKGVRNALKAGVMEYGAAHESARPWLTTATKNAESAALDTLQQTFNQKTGAT